MLLELLRTPRFVLLWMTQLFATIGDQLFYIGVMAVVYEHTNSTFQTALVTVAVTTPPFLFGAIAGTLVDRYPRRPILVGMNLVRAVLVLTLLWLLAPENFMLGGVFFVVFLLAISQTLYRPAVFATLPSLVTNEKLVRANGVIMTTNQGVMAICYIFGGLIVARAGLWVLVACVVGAYIVATLLVSFIHFAKRSPTQEIVPPLPFWTSLVEGVRYVRQHKLAWGLLSMEAFEFWPHALWSSAIMLTFTQRAIGEGVESWGYQNAAFFLGQWVGGILAVFLAVRLTRRPGWVIGGNAAIFGVLTIAYALSPNTWWAVFWCFIFGPPSSIRDVTQEALLQASVDPDKRGRVIATRDTVANLCFTLATLLCAQLADIMSIRDLYLIGGGVYLLTALYAMFNSAIRNSSIEKNEILAVAAD